MYPTTLQKPFFLLLAAASVLSSCDEVCDKGDKPQFQFTSGQREWANPFVQGTTWRFRNAAGYERSYLIKSFADDMLGRGGGKSSFCPSYYHQSLTVSLERTDSAHTASHSLQLATASYSRDTPFTAALYWDGNSFWLPIREVEEGSTPVNYNSVSSSRILAQYTAGSRTYQNVIECTIAPVVAAGKAPSSVVRIFQTKTEGIIRFETKAGTAWDRI
ncbi:hypothetical protein GCM10023185_04160 [Hymenobacter saemangeumensis]|uniref:Uncharacterized protein n=1 Tax=Hymenobacter saemangeumensis TaxID=1084522 RepID=A0ABP8HZY5_9BACT